MEKVSATPFTTYRITVYAKENEDHRFVRIAHQLGISALERCYSGRVYFVRGELTTDDVEQMAHELLADAVTEDFAITEPHKMPTIGAGNHVIDVSFMAGVTDSAAENLTRAAQHLGLSVEQTATGQTYALVGDLSPSDLEGLASRVFSNPIIQQYAINHAVTPPLMGVLHKDDTVEIIPIRQVDDTRLLAISAARRLALDIHEMRAIQAYFQEIKRDPTDVELEMIAQTWSEHCVHKTFRATITYDGPRPHDKDGAMVEQTIDGLLKTYIRAATDKVDKPWVRSAFVDNAGIIAFNEGWDIAFKVETHNHPSALEPFGGANTGVGGVVRDVLGVSARPIANTDVLCFGPQDIAPEKLPTGVLHPRRIADGVIHGIEDYGNKMGIPTVNGAIYYHQGYTANPLVFCGCLGILPRDSHPLEVRPNDLIVVIGGRTGRDGLRGATFSSMEMDQTTGQIAGSAVQIGNPITEKQVLEVVLRARDEGLYHAITDCGAGGLSSAVGEMGKDIGARVDLEKVALKYAGLRPWEVWLSEAQERMVMAVAPEHWERLQAICRGQDLEAVWIGEFVETGHLHLYDEGRLVGDLSMEFLHEGIPTRQLKAVWQFPTTEAAPRYVEDEDYNATLLSLLAHPNIQSKEEVIRRYDHEVQGGTIVKPMGGKHADSPNNGVVLMPLDVVRENTHEMGQAGVGLSVGLCPQYGELDPYIMAFAAIDEAFRNLVTMGVDPDRVAILDNFCWGNPNLPDRLGTLVRCVQGCYDAAVAYQTPFISGKDSLNNEYADEDGIRHAIPGTLLISAVGMVLNIQNTVTMDFKQAGNGVYVIGGMDTTMGGSHYHLLHGLQGGELPQPKLQALEIMRKVYQCIQQGYIQACHDCSEGGLAVTVAEMCMGGALGARIQLGAGDVVPQLFGEGLSRFVVEVRPQDQEAFEALMADIPHMVIGEVVETTTLVVATEANEIIHLDVARLKAAWRGEVIESISAASPLMDMPMVEKQKHSRQPTLRNTAPKVLILHANGTNRDREAALACRIAGGDPEIVHVNQLMGGEKSLLDYHMLVVPGGFSYGDDLGAGQLWAQDIKHRLGDDVRHFIQAGRPVLGICNGFQALVKAGLLGGDTESNAVETRRVTLTYNEVGHFECRWVYLRPNPQSVSLFTDGLDDLIYCPVAHGEGRFMVQDEATLAALHEAGLIALTYVDAAGQPSGYPYNPNGSVANIAGICNEQGNVLGLMPHPEDHIFGWQHPRWQRGEQGFSGLHLFRNGVKFA